MARLMTGPQKFTHGEWKVANEQKYAAAEGERAASERLQDHISAIIEDTQFTTNKLEAEVNRKFDEREKDVKYWEGELEHKLGQIGKELDELSSLEVRLTAAIQSIDDPLQITKACLSTRDRRIEVDLVRDAAEVNLEKEVEVCEGVLALLHRSHSQLQEQIRLLRKSRYNLEKDLKDKYVCLSVDSQARNLTNQSTHHTSIPKQKWSNLGEWASHSEAGIGDAEAQRKDAVGLRTLIIELLKSTHEDLRQQHARTMTALQRRIHETNEAKNKLQEHLSLVRKEMMSLEEKIGQLEEALSGTEGPLQQASNRLDQRAARPNVERCMDAVQMTLVKQATTIQHSAERLNETLACARQSLKALRAQQVTLEDEIKVKMQSIEVDEMKCATYTKSIHFQPF